MYFKESVPTIVGSQLWLSKSRIHRANHQEGQTGSLVPRLKPPCTGGASSSSGKSPNDGHLSHLQIPSQQLLD